MAWARMYPARGLDYKASCFIQAFYFSFALAKEK